MKIFIFIFLVIPYELFSQSNDGTIQKESEKLINTSFSVPSIPALDFLSFDPENISKPSTAKELATSLYNGIDETGKVKQGLALEAKVSKIFGFQIALNDYQTKPLAYILYNAQLSLGSIATSGDSTSTDLGWGVRLTLFDDSDPMGNQEFTRALGEKLASFAPDTPIISDSNEELESMGQSVKELNEDFAKSNWNAKWLTISYAGGSRLKGSQFTEGKIVGHQLSVAGGIKLNNWGQLGYLLKWLNRLQDGTEVKTQELNIGTNLLVGKPTYNLFVEVGYNPLLNKDELDGMINIDTEKVISWSAGVEFFVSKGVWIVAGLGQNADRIVGNDSIQLLSGLRMGISDKSRIVKE